MLHFCRLALNAAERLVKSHYGHLVLQHAVLFTQKAILQPSVKSKLHEWMELRTVALRATLQALQDTDAWSKKTNDASHFINKCLALIASDPTDKELQAARGEIVEVMLSEGSLLGDICNHSSGQFTAHRIYEIAEPQEQPYSASSMINIILVVAQSC